MDMVAIRMHAGKTCISLKLECASCDADIYMM